MLSSAHAEAPKSTSVAGIRLGDSPTNVAASLRMRYPQCDLQQSVYRASSGEKVGLLAQLAINEGTMNLCEGTPEGSDSVDTLVVRFAHPEIDATRGAFEIHLDRRYPDPALSTESGNRYPFDDVLAKLRREYGRPIDERRERVASAAANLATALGLGIGVEREEYLVRLLWAAKGELAADRRAEECDCGSVYVYAEIEISRSASTRSPGRYHVVRLALFIRDADTHRRQEVWNAQWLKLDR